jgi:peptidoglycan-associated lipoprotein
MALQKLKTAAGLAVAMALVSGCSSTQEADDAAAAEAAAAEQAAAEAAAAQAAADALAAAEAALNNVYMFAFDTSTLSADVRSDLDAQAMVLKEMPGVIRLEGHADERGTPEYNLALGERRAQAVANYLAIQGVPRAQIEVISYGEEKPAVQGYGDQVWSQNRRVELKYSK